MKNEIVIPIALCTHLKDISKYNYNYYKLPDGMLIKENNVVLQDCDENYDSYQYTLGKLEDGAFRDDGLHLTYASSYGSNINDENIVIELDRQYEYNT